MRAAYRHDFGRIQFPAGSSRRPDRPLIERFGGWTRTWWTFDFGCPKIEAGKVMDLRGVHYPDRIGR
jgi:hypothetical protein